MNWDNALQMIQEFRSQLDIWGVTNSGLLVAGGIAALLFLFSLREVATWFFRIHQVRSEVRELRAQMMAMQQTLEETRDLLSQTALENEAEVPKKKDIVLKPEGTSGARFRFDH